MAIDLLLSPRERSLLLLFACGCRLLSTLGFATERYTSSGGEVAFLNFHLVRGLLLLFSACRCRRLSTLGFAVERYTSSGGEVAFLNFYLFNLLFRLITWLSFPF